MWEDVANALNSTSTQVVVIMAILYTCNAECVASTDIYFTVTTRRNSSSHWIVSVDASRNEPKGNGSEQPLKEMVINVAHRTLSCQVQETQKLVATATVSAAPQRTIPEGYQFAAGLGYYKMHPLAVTWFEARQVCEDEGAHLVIINSDEEAQLLSRYMQEKATVPNDTNRDFSFVGAHDLGKDGDFRTVKGEPLSSTGFFKWGVGQPSGGSKQNCVDFHKTGNSGTLNDDNCDVKLSFLCELDI